MGPTPGQGWGSAPEQALQNWLLGPAWPPIWRSFPSSLDQLPRAPIFRFLVRKMGIRPVPAEPFVRIDCDPSWHPGGAP